MIENAIVTGLNSLILHYSDILPFMFGHISYFPSASAFRCLTRFSFSNRPGRLSKAHKDKEKEKEKEKEREKEQQRREEREKRDDSEETKHKSSERNGGKDERKRKHRESSGDRYASIKR